MEPFLEYKKLKEIFYGDERISSFQSYADDIRLLHHRYLEMCLTPEQNQELFNIDELYRFAEDAEYLATKYTNPLVIEKIEGLSVESIPSRQIVQDALSLSGTIYEFIADIVQWYENLDQQKHNNDSFNGKDNDLEQDTEISVFIQSIGSSKMLYLKSALCYSLGYYEPRTSVLLNRLLERTGYPNQNLSIDSHKKWVDFLLCALLARKLGTILDSRIQITQQIENIRQTLRHDLTDGSRITSRKINEILSSLSLIQACISSAQAFVTGSIDAINEAQQHISQATKSIYQVQNYEFLWIIRMFRDVLERMWLNSPWKRLEGIIPRRNYLRQLVRDGVVTLWTSQQVALEMHSKLGELQGGYLDDRIRRVVVHMPTSAGKTLLAELAIARVLFSNPNGKCVYVGPSRALCDQVTGDLSVRLARFGIRVTTVVSDQDMMDEYESMLFGKTNVIVVTPEKLSYLFRQQSSFVLETDLFIFDELHTISNLDRGWPYEEIISVLLQHPETTKAKMVFLSAVMPNHITVKEWVDPDQLNDTISELWQPTRLLKGAITFPRPWDKGDDVCLQGNLLYVRSKQDINSPLCIPNFIQSRQVIVQKKTRKQVIVQKKTRKKVRNYNKSDNSLSHAASAAIRFEKLGSVLVYTPRLVESEKFCALVIQKKLGVKVKNKKIISSKTIQKKKQNTSGQLELFGQQSVLNNNNSEELPDNYKNSNVTEELPEDYQDIIEFVKQRLPSDHALINALQHGIAFHNASLPMDVRNEIEYAFRKGWISILAATTTLVEGVNFPVKTLVIADYCWERNHNKSEQQWINKIALQKKDFRNIAGRAGRALYETEGQVIFIQSLAGYPYRSTLDESFKDYLGLEADSDELNITSVLEKSEVLDNLVQLVDAVDNGVLTEEQLLSESSNSDQDKTVSIINKLQTLALLVQQNNLTNDEEESFVNFMQNTFIGKRQPNNAPQIVGAFVHRTAKATRSVINPEERVLFAQAGLKISTCRALWQKVHLFWNKNIELLSNSQSLLDRDILLNIAKTIYDLEDGDVEPQTLRLNPKSGKKHLESDTEFFVDWIWENNMEYLLEKHFNFIKDKSWRANQYVTYTQQTMGYRVPWTLSAFWLFSKTIVKNTHSVELLSTPIGKELALLPAYAKFGVNNPVSSLFSTIGISPASLARKLGDLYNQEFPEERYSYHIMLRWLLTVEPLNLEKKGISPYFIKRLMRLLERIKPLDDEYLVIERKNRWEVKFPIAGWQYYQGESVLESMNRGEKLELRPDPENNYDNKAVAIFRNNIQLGYVPRYLSENITEQMRTQKVTASVVEIRVNAPYYEKVVVQCGLVMQNE